MTERSTQSIPEPRELFPQGTKHVSNMVKGWDLPLIEISESAEPIEYAVGSVGSAGGQS